MAKPLILIVEDEEPLTLLLRYNLEAEGYEVEVAARGDEAEIRLRERMPDLLILDWMLPGLSGIELCRRLRTPRRHGEAADPDADGARRGGRAHPRPRHRRRRLCGEAVLGAELMARVKALLRRARPEAISSLLRAGDLELDRETFRVRRSGREVHLGPTEFRLLEFLMKTPGRVFTREQLLDGVWGHDVYVDERTVDVHIGRLRRALNRGRSRDPIRTVRGAGYAFNEQFERA